MNRAAAKSMPAAHIAGLLVALLMAGCAVLEQAPAAETGRKDATQVTAVAPVPPVAPTGATPPTAATPVASVVPEQKAEAPSAPTPMAQPAAKASAPPPAKVVAPPAPAPQPAKSAASPPLDMKSLENRLKETQAIGVFTKLALKNQVDDLIAQFRAFYQGRLKTTLAELRRPYEMLLQKVLALLQDADPPLAGAIVASREAIWGILADPAKFATI